jgi:hypothetical protein
MGVGPSSRQFGVSGFKIQNLKSGFHAAAAAVTRRTQRNLISYLRLCYYFLNLGASQLVNFSKVLDFGKSIVKSRIFDLPPPDASGLQGRNLGFKIQNLRSEIYLRGIMC